MINSGRYWSLLMQLGELGESSEGWEFLPKSASQISASSAGGEKKILCHTVPFHIQTQWLSIFLSRTAVTSLSCLCPDSLTWWRPGWRGPQNMAERNVWTTPFGVRVHSQLSGEQSKSFFPLAVSRSGPRKDAILLHLSLRMPPVSRGCSVPARSTCLCQLKPDKIFERISFWKDF